MDLVARAGEIHMTLDGLDVAEYLWAQVISPKDFKRQGDKAVTVQTFGQFVALVSEIEYFTIW